VAKRLVFIGLEGFNQDLVFLWQESLPRLMAMMKEGIFGRMESSMPPIPPVAWSSLLTGKNPGQLGFWAPTYRDTFSYGEKAMASPDKLFAADPLPQILSRHGKKVAIIDVPFTYPTPVIPEGFVVSTDRVAEGKGNWTYPKELYRELEAVVGSLKVNASVFTPGYMLQDRNKVIDDAYGADRQRVEMLKYFLENRGCDFIFALLSGADRVTCLFDLFPLSKGRPWYGKGEAYETILKTYYRLCDSMIGGVRKLIGGDDILVVASANSVGVLKGRINLNEWLIREGYLVLKESLETPMPLGKAEVDCSKSKAWSAGHVGRIYVNLKGREEEGSVSESEYDSLLTELTGKLSEMKDDQGKELETKVVRRNDIYFGEFVDFGPDLVVLFDDGQWNVNPAVGMNSLFSYETNLGSDRAALAPFGFFAMTGPGIGATGEQTGVTIYDMAPTVCRLMGIPIPPNMEGRTLARG
jgi:predicted AlkP superfamily phosphohydrolase/phosphomutase